MRMLRVTLLLFTCAALTFADERAALDALVKSRPQRAIRTPTDALVDLRDVLPDAWKACAFSPAATELAAVSDWTLGVFDLHTGKLARSVGGYPVDPAGTPLAYAPDGKTLAVACRDRAVRLFDAATLRLLRTLPAHEVPLAVAFSRNGATLTAVHVRENRALATVWDTNAWQARLLVGDVQESPPLWTFAAGGKTLAILTHARNKAVTKIQLWNLARAESASLSVERWLQAPTWSADDTALFALGAPPNVLPNFPIDRPTTLYRIDAAAGEARAVADPGASTALLPTPDGKFLAIAGPPFPKMPPRLIETATGKVRWVGPPESNLFAFSPGGTFAARLTKAGQLHLLDLAQMTDPRWADLGPDFAKVAENNGSVALTRERIDVRHDTNDPQGRAFARSPTKAVQIATHLTLTGGGFALSLKEVAGAPHLEEFRIHDGRLAKDSGQVFASLKQLRKLELDGFDGMDLADWDALATAPALVDLTVKTYALPKMRAFVPLPKMTRLRSLEVRETATDADLASLAPLTELRQLRLEACRCTRDDALAVLRKMPHLDKLSLGKGPLRAEQLAPLAELKNLTELDLAQGACPGAALVHLKNLTNLTKLNLAQNGSYGKDALANLAGLTKLESLDLHGAVLEAGALQVLASFPHLKHLNLQSALIDDEELAPLAGLKELVSARVENTGIRGPGLRYLKGCAGPLDLVLLGTRIDDAGLAHIKDLSQVTRLHLPPAVTDAGLVHLAGLTRLRELYLPVGVRGTGCKHLAGLPLRVVSASFRSQIDDVGLAGLAALTDLRELDIRASLITAEGIDHLKQMTGLRKLSLPRPPSLTDKVLGELWDALPFATLNGQTPSYPR